jgi:glycosyltransferase involved in cell wall biosynthesis
VDEVRLDPTELGPREFEIAQQERVFASGSASYRVPIRLGIFAEGLYRRVETPEGPRVAGISIAHAFLLFASEVGLHFGRVVLFGRGARGEVATDHLLPPGVELVELPYYTSLRHLLQLVRAAGGTVVRTWRGLDSVDAIWVLGPHPVGYLVVLLAVLRRRRVALGVRQDTPRYFRSRMPGRHWAPVLGVVWAMDLGWRLLARRVRTTVVGTELARRYPARPTVLPITVTLVRRADLARAPRDGDWSGEVRLLTVGRLEQEKNPLLVVDLLAELESRRPGAFRLAWAGEGPLEGAVLARAEERGVADRLELLGYVAFGPALLDRYREADAFVHISFTEGVPQVLVEAMASALPVVATDVGGVAAAVGEAALLVPPANLEAVTAAVLRLADEPECRRALVERGLARAATLTLEAEAERVARFIAGNRWASANPAESR